MASASVTPNQKLHSQPVASRVARAVPAAKDAGQSKAKPKRKTPTMTATTTQKSPSDSPPVSPRSPPATFYSKARDYWDQIPATMDGMLGGYSSLNVPDTEDSHAFLDEFGPKTTAYALDCGCGIGRVTKQVLLPRFSLVDMVEMNQAFLDQAEEFIGPVDFANVGERFCSGLQDFIPPHGRYDLVWIQWVLGHLTDIALVAFLKRCAQALSPNGRIVVKENVTSDETGEAAFDDVDSSFTRSRKAFLAVFKDAGLELIGERLQTNFPPSIYPVRMFALKTADVVTEEKSATPSPPVPTSES